MRRKSESNELSQCEAMVMKLIWEAEEEISIQEVIARMNEQFHKDYARSTVVTFLGNLAEKGYISTYKVGKKAYIHAEKQEDWYKRKRVKEETDFWFDGKPSELMSALCDSGKISKEEIAKMRGILDELDA